MGPGVQDPGTLGRVPGDQWSHREPALEQALYRLSLGRARDGAVSCGHLATARLTRITVRLMGLIGLKTKDPTTTNVTHTLACDAHKY